MAVAKRKTKGGFTREYHYDFSQDGKRYRGVCEGCTTKREADDFEKKLIEHVKTASAETNVKHLVEHFRNVLSGGTDILLPDAYECSLQKPKKRTPSEELIKVKRAYWLDFVAYMAETYPAVQKLADVQPRHAEAYIQQLRKNGRFNKTVSYTGNKIKKVRSYQLKSSLSAKTVNTYQQVLEEVFRLLARDAGIVENPFSAIPMLGKEAETRDAFTKEELLTIRDNLDDFTAPLFTLAISTALREGDICTLKWSEIDFQKDVILRRMRKTGNIVEIPIMPPLREYLLALQSKEQNISGDFQEYVLPEHAKIYLQNSSGVSYRIKQFLEKRCQIVTTRVPAGRDRAVSVKDLHSCRHTFCYYAGLYGIPLSIVQSIVGHMTPEMTKHYSDHASMEAKREKMKQMPSFMVFLPEVSQSELAQEDGLRKMLYDRISRMKLEQLKELSAFIEQI